MSVAERKAWITEAMKLSHWFRVNATTRHGVPENSPITTLGNEVDPPPVKPEPPVVNITNQIPAAPPANNSPSPGAVAASAGSSLLRRAAPFLLAAATGSGIPLAAWSLFGKSEPPVVQSEAERDGSLLQALEDAGHHLPEGWGDE